MEDEACSSPKSRYPQFKTYCVQWKKHVREDCAQRLDEVDKAMPSLVLEARDAAGNDLGAVRVTLDGAPLTVKLDGTAIAVDPGEHRLTFEAVGLPKVEKSLIVREGDKGRHERIVLGVAQASPTQASQPAPTQASHGVPMLAIVAGGVGVAGLAVGVATAIAATSKHTTLQGECSASLCPPSTQGDLDSFHSLRTGSAIGYVVGGLGIVGGAALWVFAPSRPSDTSVGLWVGPGSAGVTGTFR